MVYAVFYRFCRREVAAVRYIRMACEVLGPTGDEKSGCRDLRLAYSSMMELKSTIPSYKDNRFNSVFVAAVSILQHRMDITSCQYSPAQDGHHQLSVFSSTGWTSSAVSILQHRMDIISCQYSPAQDGHHQLSVFSSTGWTSSAVRILQHRMDIISFLQDCMPTRNQKLESVLQDAISEEVNIFVGALAMLFYRVTGPYWQLLCVGKMKYAEFFMPVELPMQLKEWADDSSSTFMETVPSLFGAPLNNRFHTLLQFDEDSRPKVQQAISAICQAFVEVTERQLCDFLPDGGYHAVQDPAVLAKREHSHITNLLGEACFGDLDVSIYTQRNTSVHHHSTLIMLKRNKTMTEWFLKNSAASYKCHLQRLPDCENGTKSSIKMWLLPKGSALRSSTKRRSRVRRTWPGQKPVFWLKLTNLVEPSLQSLMLSDFWKDADFRERKSVLWKHACISSRWCWDSNQSTWNWPRTYPTLFSPWRLFWEKKIPFHDFWMPLICMLQIHCLIRTPVTLSLRRWKLKRNRIVSFLSPTYIQNQMLKMKLLRPLPHLVYKTLFLQSFDLERLVRMLPFSMTTTFMLDRWQRSSVNMKQKFNSCGRVLWQTIRTRGLPFPRQILTQLHAYLCLTLTFLSPQQMDAYGTSQVVTLCKRNTSCTSKHTHEGDNKIFLFFLLFFI